MFMSRQMVILIVMFSCGTVSVCGEIVKFSGSLVPIISTCPARCASASFIASVPHELILSLMKLECITLLFGRMYCLSPLRKSDPAHSSLAGYFSMSRL
jgi:hypothetical protein